MAIIETFFNEALQQELRLTKPISTVGRLTNNDIHIDNMAVSSRHAMIKQDNGNYYIEDNNSTNGTYLNGKRIKRSQLTDGDIVTICKHHLKFKSETSKSGLNRPVATEEAGQTVVFDQSKMKDLLREHRLESAQSKGESSGWLLVTEPVSKRHPLTDTVTVGKHANADIRLGGWFAPKLAAVFENQSNGYYVISKNRGKVKINGKPISGSAKLKNTDVIQVRNIELRFYVTIKG